VLCQDHVGGLQLMKGARWVAVKPIPGALIVNVGDLFQVRTRTPITLLDPSI
jgi:gibberellin 2-oxidase